MRHLSGLAPIEVALLPRRMVSLTRIRLLVAAARSPDRVAPPQLGAAVRAVHVTVVAPPAQEEHLPTATADDEA